MGDFNFHSTWEENEKIPGDFSDIWASIHPDKDGFTEDTHVNEMRYSVRHRGEHKQVRFDRILIKSDDWIESSISRLGTEPIDDTEVEIPENLDGEKTKVFL
eukprot:TRINITY_DN14399_c0_g1_i1.p1 TRINITY_DN14399_c0_g1~~TRINITY_DN14399_c0_g1_i1.p1  ORF type:complete len:102 (+),score=21.23 TRINITY_DN14399_c0_g1_i1:284-589(+)